MMHNIECWLGSFVIFEDRDQYCLETLQFCELSVGRPAPCPTFGFAHGYIIKNNK